LKEKLILSNNLPLDIDEFIDTCHAQLITGIGYIDSDFLTNTSSSVRNFLGEQLAMRSFVSDEYLGENGQN
jgi:hypothetical protein